MFHVLKNTSTLLLRLSFALDPSGGGGLQRSLDPLAGLKGVALRRRRDERERDNAKNGLEGKKREG